MKVGKAAGWALALTVSLLALTYATDVAARAGRSGGTMRPAKVYVMGGGIVALLLYSGAMTFWTVRRGRQAKRLTELLAHYDAAWDLDRIKDRIARAYYVIQRAWGDGDLSPARSFMSKHLYENYKSEVLGLRLLKMRNKLDYIMLKSVRIVEVLDYEEDARDRFVALIEGSMIDAVIDEYGNTVKGDANKTQYFTELWQFAREPHGWVLDSIDHEVSLEDLARLRSVSEIFHRRTA